MKFLAATSTLVGMIVGVGVFAIPYAVARSGFLVGLFYFVLVGGLVLLMHRFYGDIVLEASGRHRLIGYAERYLGEWGRRIVTVTSVLGLAGGLLVYLLVGSQFFALLFGGGEPLAIGGLLLLGFFAAAAGFRSFGRFELFMTAFLLATMFLLFFASLRHFQPFPIFAVGNGRNLFLPYGVLLFASSGSVAVPLLVDLLAGERRRVASAITIGTFLPLVLYLLFTVAVLGVSGSATTPEAIRGLEPILGRPVVVIGALFGILAVLTSYLVLTRYFASTLELDGGVPRIFALTFASAIPLVLLLLGVRDFVPIIGFIGAVFLGTEGIIISLIHRKLNRPVPKVIYPIIVGLFGLGAILYIIFAGA